MPIFSPPRRYASLITTVRATLSFRYYYAFAISRRSSMLLLSLLIRHCFRLPPLLDD